MKKCLSLILTVVILLSVAFVTPVGAEAASSKTLYLNSTLLKKVGKQTPYSVSCACFSMAYCRTMLDNKVHYFSEYNLNGNDEYNASCDWSRGSYKKMYAGSKANLFKACYEYINNNQPIIIHLNHSTNGQHWVTVVGYEGVNDVNSMTMNNLLVIDPLKGFTGSPQKISSGYSINTSYRYQCPTSSSDTVTNTESNTYSFSFDANGGTLGSKGEFSVSYGQQFQILNTTCTREGYNWAGWNVKRNNDDKWYVEGQGWCSESEISSKGYTKKVYSNNQTCTFDDSWINGLSGDVVYTFYAVWEANTYTVSFNANEGSVSSTSKTVTFNSTYGALPVPTRVGYTFAGWYTSTEGGTLVTGGAKVTTAADHTLYAHWEGNRIVATLDVGHSGINPNMFQSPCESITVNGIEYSYDADTGILTLNGTTSQAITQIGTAPFWVNVGDVYTVSGYYISGSVSDGELCYDVCGADGNRVSDRRYLAMRNTDSFVTWNFTTEDSTNTERENAAGSYLKLWIDNSNDGKDVVFDNYKIRIKLEKGSKATDYSPARFVTKVGEAYGDLPTVYRKGYTFDGWYTSAEGGSKVTSATKASEATNQTLYAHWEGNRVVATFDVGHSGINPNMFQSPCESVTVNGIEYSYDSETGILTLNGTTSQAITQIGTTAFWVSVGDMYTVSSYYVSGSVSDGELCYDVCGADGNRVSDRRYLAMRNTDSFVTWNFTTEDSTNTERENAAGSYLKLWIDNSNDGKDVVFDNYKIRIKLEKGSEATDYSPARIVTKVGEAYGDLPTVYRKGYTFDGWYTSAEGGSQITSSTKVTEVDNQTLYAHWEGNKVVSTFDVGHSGINPNMFQSPCESVTVNGIEYSYDSETGILTLNGTTSQAITQIGTTAFWVSVGDVYTVSSYYVSGSVSDGELCYDVCGADGNRVSDRRYLTMRNTDSYVTWEFTTKDSTNTERENAAGSYLKLWIDNSNDGKDVVFDNYKIRIKLEKGSKATDYSPARLVIRVGDIYGKLPTPTRQGYSFDGWYTNVENGSEVTETTVCTDDMYKTLYAKWTCKHSVTEVRNAKSATCSSEGYTGDTHCKLCGVKTKTGTSIAKLGHSWTAATCTTKKTCSTCGTTDGSVLGHDYTSKVTTDATCTIDGVKTYTCSRCSDSYTESIAATGHSWTAATCTSKKTCSTCGTTDGSVLGHDYTSKVTRDATCTIDGVRTYTCSRCTDSYTEAIFAKGHTEAIDEAVAPSCSKTGLTEGKRCSVCGVTLLKQTEVKALGHTEVITKGHEANCTENGLTDSVHCSVCKEVLTEASVIDAKGHSVDEDWTIISTSDTGKITQVKYCTDCGVVLETREITQDITNPSNPTDPTEPSTGEEDKPTEPTEPSTGEESKPTEPSTGGEDIPTDPTNPVEIGLLGDANGDSKVNIKDATLIQKSIANLTTLTKTGEALADADLNTKINIKDATAIQKHIAGIETGYPIGKPKTK